MYEGEFVQTKGASDPSLAGSMGLMSQVQWRSNDDFLRPISDQKSLHVTFW